MYNNNLRLIWLENLRILLIMMKKKKTMGEKNFWWNLELKCLWAGSSWNMRPEKLYNFLNF